MQEAEALGSADTELGQELKQLKEKDRVKTMFSLLTRIGVVVSLRGKREKVFSVREGRCWIHNILQPCLQEKRNRGGMVS